MHSLIASLPINETPSRIVIDFNGLHFKKADLPFVVSIFESVIDEIDLQCEKA